MYSLSSIFGAENFWMAILLVSIKTDLVQERPKPERWACPWWRHGLAIKNFRVRAFLDSDSVGPSDTERSRKGPEMGPKRNRHGAKPSRTETEPNRTEAEPIRKRAEPEQNRNYMDLIGAYLGSKNHQKSCFGEWLGETFCAFFACAKRWLAQILLEWAPRCANFAVLRFFSLGVLVLFCH